MQVHVIVFTVLGSGFALVMFGHQILGAEVMGAAILMWRTYIHGISGTGDRRRRR